GVCGGDQRDALGSVACRVLERDQRAHRMADHAWFLNFDVLENLENPIRHCLDARNRWSCGTAVAGKVERQHVPAVIAEVAALQPEPGMVEAGAVQEAGRRLPGVELAGGGMGEDQLAFDLEIHFTAALRARSRSAIRSCGSSRPIDRRTVPAVMPARFRSASLIR